MLAQHVLYVGDRPWRRRGPACRTRARRPRPRTAPASRGCGPGAARRRARDRAGRRRRCAGASTARARGRAASRRGRHPTSITTRRSLRRVDEPVEQLRGSGRCADRRAARRAPASRSASSRCRSGAAAAWSSGSSFGDPALEPLEQHVGVAHRAELVAEPPELVAQRLRPLGIEQLAERAQVRPQATRRDARLVHAFGVVADPHDGVVGDELGDGVGDRVADDGVDGGRLAHRVRHDVGRQGGGGAEGADDLGQWVAVGRAGVAQPPDDVVHGLGRRVVGELELDLAEVTADAAVDDRAVVVGERADRRRVRLAQLGRDGERCAIAPPARAERCGRAPRRARGPRSAAPRPRPPKTNSERTSAEPLPLLRVGRQLHRPAVVVAEPQRRARAGQSQVGGVVVGGGLLDDGVARAAVHRSSSPGISKSSGTRNLNSCSWVAAVPMLTCGRCARATARWYSSDCAFTPWPLRHARPRAVVVQLPRELGVGQLDGEDLVEPLAQSRRPSPAPAPRPDGRGCGA